MSGCYHFTKALLPDGWADNVRITVQDGIIAHVDAGAARGPTEATVVNGYAMPGMANAHSHAFQRAFAGLAEFRTASRDSFWTWRKLMYDFLKKLTPDDVHRIGHKLYSEMRLAGYSTVGEFHYLLHQPDGTPYDNVNEMADALIQAALDADLNICILPAYYQRGGFDNAPLTGGQLRFGSSRDVFLQMVQKLKQDWWTHPNVQIGIALHSLRAVSVSAAQAIILEIDNILGDCPIHIHVAEQTGEVEDCLAATGRRPVQLLLDSFDINQRWCLVHATHMNDQECRDLAGRGAVVAVCPSTEANLGDGIFMSEQYLQRAGQLAIGSDSHICINPWEELRTLEYAQRLIQRRRSVLCTDSVSCGSYLFETAIRGGSWATGFWNGGLQPGSSVKISVIDPLRFFEPMSDQRILDYLVFQSSLGLNGNIATPLPG